jgi:hypothetical protein
LVVFFSSSGSPCSSTWLEEVDPNRNAMFMILAEQNC